MEVFKDLVKFNRYKSVESFNNDKDITSSTISIVKLDENVMDIYLGRTRITHSNLLKANNELKNLINYLDNKLKDLESDVDNNKKSIININTKQNNNSQSISNIKSDIDALRSEDIHILKILGDINKKLSNITDNNVIPSFSDISTIKQNIENISKELSDKIKSNISEIKKLKTKDSSITENISVIKKDIDALYREDIHIFEIINGLQSVSKTIMSDIKFIKNDNENINDEIISLKEKIRFLTGVNVDNIETLEGANRRLTKLEKSDKEFQTKVDEINSDINSIKENVKKLQSFESTTNENIKSLEEQIEELSSVALIDIEKRLNELSSTDEELQKNTNELISVVDEIKKGFTTFATKEYVDDKVDGKFDAAGTAAGLNAIIDERVTELEKINHSDYITEEKLASKGYLTSDIADKKYAPIGTTGSGESIDLTDYATIEYVKETYANKSDIPVVPTDISSFNNDKGYLTEKDITDKLTDKQDVISDLDIIRSGATAGSTALQSIPEEYITEKELVNKGYLTEQSLNEYAKKSDIPKLEWLNL